MESNSRFGAMWSKFTDSLNDQQWFQDLKSKWEELDPQSRMYLKAASAATVVLLAAVIVLSSIWNVHKLKVELAERSDLLNLIQNANDEVRKLRESGAGLPSDAPSGPWAAYIEGSGSTAGIDKNSLSISEEKAGTATDLAKESLMDVTLKHVNIKQIVRLAFNLENGARPVKLRNLSIDTKNDPTGYLDATLAVSAFSVKPPEK